MFFTFIVFSMAHASQNFEQDLIYSGDDLGQVELADIAVDIKPGSIIIVSEYHADSRSGYNEHQLKQLAFLEELERSHPNTKINVGMEFFDYTDQDLIDSFLMGQIDEATFLNQTGWGNNDYPSYRPLVEFPNRSNAMTIGLNLPRSISGQIARKGINGLTDDERALLPPNFEVGRQEYRERFEAIMGGHVPQDAFDRYFAAQSSWDDTMAFHAVEFMKSRQDEFLVIIVGDFHAKYGGGLPDRILKR